MLSGSMLPFIPIHARFLVKPVIGNRLSIGDIIVFGQDEKLIAHFVVGVKKVGNKIYFLQQGNRGSTPSLIAEEFVIGKAHALESNGRIVHFDTLWRRLMHVKTALFLRLKHELSKMVNF